MVAIYYLEREQDCLGEVVVHLRPKQLCRLREAFGTRGLPILALNPPEHVFLRREHRRGRTYTQTLYAAVEAEREDVIRFLRREQTDASAEDFEILLLKIRLTLGQTVHAVSGAERARLSKLESAWKPQVRTLAIHLRRGAASVDEMLSFLRIFLPRSAPSDVVSPDGVYAPLEESGEGLQTRLMQSRRVRFLLSLCVCLQREGLTELAGKLCDLYHHHLTARQYAMLVVHLLVLQVWVCSEGDLIGAFAPWKARLGPAAITWLTFDDIASMLDATLSDLILQFDLVPSASDIDIYSARTIHVGFSIETVQAALETSSTATATFSSDVAGGAGAADWTQMESAGPPGPPVAGEMRPPAYLPTSREEKLGACLNGWFRTRRRLEQLFADCDIDLCLAMGPRVRSRLENATKIAFRMGDSFAWARYLAETQQMEGAGATSGAAEEPTMKTIEREMLPMQVGGPSFLIENCLPLTPGAERVQMPSAPLLAHATHKMLYRHSTKEWPSNVHRFFLSRGHLHPEGFLALLPCWALSSGNLQICLRNCVTAVLVACRSRCRDFVSKVVQFVKKYLPRPLTALNWTSRVHTLHRPAKVAFELVSSGSLELLSLIEILALPTFLIQACAQDSQALRRLFIGADGDKVAARALAHSEAERAYCLKAGFDAPAPFHFSLQWERVSTVILAYGIDRLPRTFDLICKHRMWLGGSINSFATWRTFEWLVYTYRVPAAAIPPLSLRVKDLLPAEHDAVKRLIRKGCLKPWVRELSASFGLVGAIDLQRHLLEMK